MSETFAPEKRVKRLSREQARKVWEPALSVSMFDKIAVNIPYMKIGSRKYYELKDILEYINNDKRGAGCQSIKGRIHPITNIPPYL